MSSKKKTRVDKQYMMVVREMEGMDLVRKRMGSSKRLLAGVDDEEFIKPSKRNLVFYHPVCRPFLRQMANQDSWKTPTIPTLKAVIKLIAKDTGIFLDADALQTNAWDMKRFLTKIRTMAVTPKKLLAAAFSAAFRANP